MALTEPVVWPRPKPPKQPDYWAPFWPENTPQSQLDKQRQGSIYSGVSDALYRYWNSIKNGFNSGNEAVDETVNGWLTIIGDVKIQIDELFTEQEIEEKWKARVVTVFDACQALEAFRIKNLKDEVQEKWQACKDIYDLAVGGYQAVTPGGGPPDSGYAVKIGSWIQRGMQLNQNLMEIARKLVEILELFNIVTEQQKKIQDAALFQGNQELRVGGDVEPQTRRRLRA